MRQFMLKSGSLLLLASLLFNTALAAEQGYVPAPYIIGALYQTGEGAPQDTAQAAFWYKKAAEQGLVDAQYRLGELYEQGLGVDKDMSQARSWYEKAAAQGHGEAQQKLAGK